MYGVIKSAAETEKFLTTESKKSPTKIVSHFSLDPEKAIEQLYTVVRNHPSSDYDTEKIISQTEEAILDAVTSKPEIKIFSLSYYPIFGVTVIMAAYERPKMVAPGVAGPGLEDMFSYAGDDYDKQHDIMLNLVREYRREAKPVAGFDISKADILGLVAPQIPKI